MNQHTLENGYKLNTCPANKTSRLFNFAGSSVEQQLAVRIDKTGAPVGPWFARRRYKDVWGVEVVCLGTNCDHSLLERQCGEDSASWGLCGSGWIEVSGGMNYTGNVRLPRI